MNRLIFLILILLHFIVIQAGVVEKIYYFDFFRIKTIGSYTAVTFDCTMLSAFPGEPLMPWQKVMLMIPPGEKAATIEIVREDEAKIPGQLILYPQQFVRPLSDTTFTEFFMKEDVYRLKSPYPANPAGRLMTQYLNGYAFALCSFTPAKYIPLKHSFSFYRKVTVRITTIPDSGSIKALNNLPVQEEERKRIRSLAQNPEMMRLYPVHRNPLVNYHLLIICPASFQNEFQPLISMYNGKGIATRVITLDSIYTVSSGWDNPEKIRNFIIGQRQNHNIEYVLLAGNPPLMPYRGFYCYVQSGGGYTDYNIPADIYFSGLDGTYDANGNHIYGEIADTADLLPDVAVARFTVNDTAQLHRMIRKTVSYQTNPVLGELNKPLLAAEYLYNDPLTFGGPFMDLLVNDHNDNEYFTHGIPSGSNMIDKLYDTLISNPPLNIWYWSAGTLIAKINQGRSFIHHVGHANTTNMLKMNINTISNATFYAVNGIDHNFTILYTQGCYCGQFDAGGSGCIGAKAVTIDNFCVAGIFNSRYGWFNQGTTDGPSEHLQREFVSALYHDTIAERHLGKAHMISKIETAPWVSLPGEFEPGAQRWCHYCCNVFGDPALEIWTSEPVSFISNTWIGAIDTDWDKPGNWSSGTVPTSLNNVIIAGAPNQPVINTINTAVCHDLTIQPGGTLTIQPGKSMIVRGNVLLASP